MHIVCVYSKISLCETPLGQNKLMRSSGFRRCCTKIKMTVLQRKCKCVLFIEVHVPLLQGVLNMGFHNTQCTVHVHVCTILDAAFCICWGEFLGRNDRGRVVPLMTAVVFSTPCSVYEKQ